MACKRKKCCASRKLIVSGWKRAKKRAIEKNICRFLFFFLHFLEIFVKIVANLALFVKNVDFFKQLS